MRPEFEVGAQCKLNLSSGVFGDVSLMGDEEVAHPLVQWSHEDSKFDILQGTFLDKGIC
jgi:hypothetical protein